MWKIKFIKNFVVQIVKKGEAKIRLDNLILFSNGDSGLILSSKIENDNTTTAMVSLITKSISKPLSISDKVTIAKESIFTNVSENFLGKMINFKGEIIKQINSKAPHNEKSNEPVKRPIDINRVVMMERDVVSKSFPSGSMLIDILIPVGKGQRQLILGDKSSGKTRLAIDFIKASYHETNNVYIYVAIGKTLQEIESVRYYLEKNNLADRTIIMESTINDTNAAKTLVPYAATTVAEHFKDLKKDVLIIYDDLSKHADAYRATSLNIGLPPSREAYPGDIFYLHSRLLERSGAFKGLGTITALPIVETIEEDYTGYIPSNIVSISDGQIATSLNKKNLNIFPPINIGPSVSRIGSNAQHNILKKFKSSATRLLASYENNEDQYSNLAWSTNDDYSGYVLSNMVSQGSNHIYEAWKSFIFSIMYSNNLIEYAFDVELIKRIKNSTIAMIEKNHKMLELIKNITTTEQVETMEKIIINFIKPIVSFELRRKFKDNELILSQILEKYHGFNYLLSKNQEEEVAKTMVMDISTDEFVLSKNKKKELDKHSKRHKKSKKKEDPESKFESDNSINDGKDDPKQKEDPESKFESDHSINDGEDDPKQKEDVANNINADNSNLDSDNSESVNDAENQVVEETTKKTSKKELKKLKKLEKRESKKSKKKNDTKSTNEDTDNNNLDEEIKDIDNENNEPINNNENNEPINNNENNEPINNNEETQDENNDQDNRSDNDTTNEDLNSEVSTDNNTTDEIVEENDNESQQLETKVENDTTEDTVADDDTKAKNNKKISSENGVANAKYE